VTTSDSRGGGSTGSGGRNLPAGYPAALAGQIGSPAGHTGAPAQALRGLADVLATLPRETPAGTGPDLAESRAVGTAANGQVRAEVSGLGRLEALTIDPKFLRGGMVSVADAVLEAVQAAQDQATARTGEALGELSGPAAPDLAAAATAAAAGMSRLDDMLHELGTFSRRLEGGPR
jgi:DNA-binding protein YbaB